MAQLFGRRDARRNPTEKKTDVDDMLESLETQVSGTESIIREYRERILQALDAETDGLKQKAEQDSTQLIARAEQQSRSILEAARQEAQQILAASQARATEESARKILEAQQKAEQILKDVDRRAEERAKERTRHEAERIVAKAKEEADKAIAQAKQDASAEAERITAESKMEAERVVSEAREKAYLEARQETVKAISETREKATAIMMEFIERGRAQAKSEFARAASEFKSKMESEMPRLVAQVSGSIGHVIEESEINVQAELELLANIISEADAKLKPLGEMAGTAAEAPPTEDVDASPRTGDDRLFKDCVNLEIIPPFDRAQFGSVRDRLTKIPGLKVISTGGFAGTNKWVTTYTVKLEQPMPLLKLLKTVLAIESIAENKGNIIITLKSSEAT